MELLNPLSPPLVLTLMATQYALFGSRPVMTDVLCSKSCSVTNTASLSIGKKVVQSFTRTGS